MSEAGSAPWRRVGVAVAAAAIVGAWWVIGRTLDPSAWLTVDGLRVTVGAEHWYGPFLYVGVFLAAVFLPIPKIVLLGLAGVLFGPLRGFLAAWAGQVLGMSLLFVLARGLLRDTTESLLVRHSDAVRRIDARVAHDGFRVVALLRLFYFMGTPWSVLLSTTRVRLRDFVGGTALGVVPAVALAVLSGDSAAAGATGVKAALIGVAVVLVVGVGTVVRRRLGV